MHVWGDDLLPLLRILSRTKGNVGYTLISIEKKKEKKSGHLVSPKDVAVLDSAVNNT